MDKQEALKLIASVPHWHHRIELLPGVQTPGSYDPTFLWHYLELPEDLSGMRVLEIGPSDAFFSLKLAERGARPVVVDYRSKNEHGFGVMEKISGLSIDYRTMNLYDIKRDDFGRFDFVLFLGVLYHLPDMMRALVTLRQVCQGRVFVETHCSVDLSPEIPAARYYPSSTLHNDWTNFWSPNPLCVDGMLEDAGFDVLRRRQWGDRYLAVADVNDDPCRKTKIEVGYGLLAQA